MSDSIISPDLKLRIRAGQAKSAIRQLAGFRARLDDLAAACQLLAERYPELDLVAIAEEIAEEQSRAEAYVAQNLVGSAIAARAEQAYRDITEKAA